MSFKCQSKLCGRKYAALAILQVKPKPHASCCYSTLTNDDVFLVPKVLGWCWCLLFQLWPRPRRKMVVAAAHNVEYPKLTLRVQDVKECHRSPTQSGVSSTCFKNTVCCLEVVQTRVQICILSKPNKKHVLSVLSSLVCAITMSSQNRMSACKVFGIKVSLFQASSMLSSLLS